MAANTIILLEDDIPLRELFAFALKEEGYEVIEDENSKNILPLIERHQPALIITDLVMPDHEGVEGIFGTLKQHDIPIIAISSYANYLRIVEPYVSATLIKPISIDELLISVKKLIA